MEHIEWSKNNFDFKPIKTKYNSYNSEYFPESVDFVEPQNSTYSPAYLKKKIFDTWPETKKFVKYRALSLFELLNRRIVDENQKGNK